MTPSRFAWLIGLVAAAILLAAFANRISDRIRVPRAGGVPGRRCRRF